MNKEKRKLRKSAHSELINVPRGKRSDFLKITITLPPNLWSEIKKISTRRKLEGEKDYDISSLIREALAEWLKSLVVDLVLEDNIEKLMEK